jgi:serine/threonine-protein kinase
VLSRFQREAEAAASISHPNAVGVYDVALTRSGSPYLVCEYLDGVDLSTHIKANAPLTPATAKHIALQVCDALIEAHSRGVVHRDLKPQNVFLVGNFADGVPERPTAKVLDFGLSRFVGGGDSELTKTGVVMGTPSYMAPEQARGERVDHRADVYGVGALLFAMMTGRPPFKTETPQATVLAVMNEDAPRPTSLNPNIPPSLEFVIQHAMAKDPDQRYQDMKSLRDAIAELEDAPRANLSSSDSISSAKTQVIGSRTLVNRDRELHGVRLRFVLFGLLSTIALLASASAAVAGAITLAFGRWPLTQMETVLTLLIVVGTLLFPCVLLVRQLRKRIWDNTAKVYTVLSRMREGVIAAMFGYGAGALAWLFIDNVLMHFINAPVLAANAGLRWPWTPVVLFLVAALVYGGTHLRARLQSSDGWVAAATNDRQHRLRLFVSGPLLTSLTIGGAVALLIAGTLSRTNGKPSDVTHASAPPMLVNVPAGRAPLTSAPEQAGTTSGGSSQSATPVGDDGEQTPTTADAGAAPTMVDASPASMEIALATAPELSAAIAEGTAGLDALLQRYPNDPKVMRALAMGQASRAATLLDATHTLRKLFAISPQSVNDKDLQRILLQTTRVRGEAQDAAFELLATGMGDVGPDLLYKISLSQPKQRLSALRALARPEVRRSFSPGLAIAYDLRFAESCAARLPLLARAAQLGDQRSIRVLTPLATPPTKCPRGKTCPATCPDEAHRYLDTVERISKRLRRR